MRIAPYSIILLTGALGFAILDEPVPFLILLFAALLNESLRAWAFTEDDDASTPL